MLLVNSKNFRPELLVNDLKTVERGPNSRVIIIVQNVREVTLDLSGIRIQTFHVFFVHCQSHCPKITGGDI